MCKITILTKHNSLELKTLITEVWKNMSNTEKDGYGATWVMPNGKIAHVKSSLPSLFNKMPDFIEGFYHLEGELVSDGGALLIHGRTATCDKNVTNTHPMICGNSALVHNGIVKSNTYKNIKTSCDSELLLNAFKHEGVKAIEKHIYGYYAFSILSVKKNDIQIDVVRDSSASLYCGEIKENEWAFATTHDLLKICDVNNVFEYKKNTHVKFINGVLVSVSKIKPSVNNYDYTMEKKKQKAFGQSYFEEYKKRTNDRKLESENESELKLYNSERIEF